MSEDQSLATNTPRPAPATQVTDSTNAIADRFGMSAQTVRDVLDADVFCAPAGNLKGKSR